MKKFNSILAIAAVALTSVFGFTSCDKADEPFNSCPNPQPEVQNHPKAVEATDAYLLVPATTEQMQYMDATFTVNADGYTVQVKMSEMTEVNGFENCNYSKKVLNMFNSYNENSTESELKILGYNLGKVHKANITSIKYFAYPMELDHKINIFAGSAIINEKGASVSNQEIIQFYPSTFDVKGMIEKFNIYYNK